jgi:hypothetical protein
MYVWTAIIVQEQQSLSLALYWHGYNLSFKLHGWRIGLGKFGSITDCTSLTTSVGPSFGLSLTDMLITLESLVHRDKIGKPILTMINQSSPLWPKFRGLISLAEGLTLPADIRKQAILCIIQRLLKRRRDRLLLPGWDDVANTSIFTEFLFELRDKSVDAELITLLQAQLTIVRELSVMRQIHRSFHCACLP